MPNSRDKETQFLDFHSERSCPLGCYRIAHSQWETLLRPILRLVPRLPNMAKLSLVLLSASVQVILEPGCFSLQQVLS